MESDNDSLLGKLAVERGLLTQEQLNESLANQCEMRDDMGIDQPLARILLGKRWLNEDQLTELSKAIAVRTGDVRRVGGYEIVARLGQGGMGAVYKARHVGTGQFVALKILPPSLATERLVVRFKREAEMTRKLKSDNIVGCVEFGFDERRKCHFCALEFIEGEDLRARIKKAGKLPEQEAVAIARGIAKGLQDAYLNGLVHRDVKPANIMVTPDGKAKLLDLGLARATEQQDVRLTQSGAFVGSAYYASPEQAGGKDDIDIRADVYSLAATLYHMVTGSPPFEGGKLMTVLQGQIKKTVPWPAEVAPEVSDELSAVIAKAMAKDPDERYETPEDLAADLDLLSAGAEPAAVGDAPRKSTVARPRRRGRAARARRGREAAGAGRGRVRQPQSEAPQERSKMPYAVAGGALAGLAALGILFAVGRARRKPRGPAPPVAAVPEPDKAPPSDNVPPPGEVAPTPPPPEGAAPTPPPPVVDTPAPEPPELVIPEVAVPGPAPITMPVAPTRAGPWPGVWAEIEAGKVKGGEIAASPQASGGSYVGSFNRTGNQAAIDLGIGKPMADARLLVRVARWGTDNGQLNVALTGAGGEVFTRRIDTRKGGGFHWESMASGDLAPGTYTVNLRCPAERAGGALDLVGIVPGVTLLDWQPPNEAVEGRLPGFGMDPAGADTLVDTLTKGLVGWWKFDETEGARARDSSGKGALGKIKGAARVAGKLGGALSFDGSDDLIEFGAQDIDPPWSLGVWVKRQAGPKRVTTLMNSAKFSLRLKQIGTTDKLGFTRYRVKDYVFDAAAPVGVWSHVTFVGTAEGTSVYVDGAKRASHPATISMPMQGFGRGSDHSPKALIDDIRAYGRALSDEEIRALATGRAPAPPPVEVTRGLVGHWRFDEGEGPTARDLSANANHLTLEGARWAAGRTGGALSFGEGEALATVESPRGLPSGDAPKAIAAWFKARAFRSNHNVGGFGNNVHGENFQVGVDRGRFVVWGWWIGKDWHTKVDATGFADGEWHHIAVSYEAKTTKLYLDGRERASTQRFIYGATPQRVVIGNEIDKKGHTFGGAVDEFRIYDRALAPEEVAALAGVRAPAGGAPTRGLIAHWEFDEGEGKTARDSSGKGNDGLLQNDPTWAPGKFGGAISFNGRNSYVDVRPPPGLTGSAITVSAWVNYAEVPTAGWSNVVIAQDDAKTRIFQLVARRGKLCWHRFGKGQDILAREPIVAGAWQHVAATFDGTTHSFYVDGALEGKAPGTLGFDPRLHVRIGMKGSGEFAFKGLIDDVRMYGRALSGEEVTALFEGRTGPVPPAGPEAPKRPGRLLVELDELLMKGDHAGAQAWATKAAGDDKYAEAAKEIASAVGVCKVLEARGKAALAGAKARVGEKAELAARVGRPRKGEVKAVTEKGIDLVTKFVIAAGGKRLEREKRLTVMWAELALGQVDELAREGGWKDAGPDAAVAAAYLALGHKKSEAAEKALEKAGDHPLAAHLAIVIEQSRKPAEKAAPKTGMIVKRGPAVPARGLVGWWRFDELKGQTAQDHSGKGNHGNIVGATWARGRSGGALNFADPSHHVKIADHPALDLTGQFTIATWVFWRAPGGRRSTILAKAAPGRPGNYAIKPRRGSTSFGFWWDNVGAKGAYSTIELKRNAWALIVVTADAAHPTDPWMKIYVNGAEAATYGTGKFRTSRRPRATDDPLYIGGMPNETNDCNFNGLIDEVLIYDRVLTPQEMRALLGASAARQPPRITSAAPAMAAAGSPFSYKIEASGNPAPKLTVKGLPRWLEFDGTDTISGTPGKGNIGATVSVTITASNSAGRMDTQRLRIKVLKADPGLAGWWKFDEVAGDIARDSSGRGNHARITGGTRVRGRAGNALHFDGTDDYVEIPSAATAGLKRFTFSLWVKTTEKRSSEAHWHRPCLFGQATKGVPSGDLSINTNNGYVGSFHGLYPRGDKIHLSRTRRINDGRWHHLALANDGESAMLYVDGTREVALPTGLALNSTAFRVGAQGGTDESGFHHSGVIDDVRVYTRALSAAELRAIMGLAGSTAATKAPSAPAAAPGAKAVTAAEIGVAPAEKGPGARAGEAKLEATLREFDAKLEARDFDGARRAIPAGPRDATAEAAARLAGSFAAWRDAARRAAGALKGSEAEIESRKGKVSGTVLEVDDSGITVVFRIKEGRRVIGESKTSVAWRDLTLRQQHKLAASGGWKLGGSDRAVFDAVLALWQKDADSARKSLARAPGHTLAAHYRGRVDVQRLGEVEAAALRAWERAEKLFTAKDMKGAKAAYEAFEREHGKTRTAARLAAALRERRDAIDRVIVPREIKVDLGGGVLMEFVLVPAGEFSMGEEDVAEPVHKVKITKPFYLGKYEVTQAQYEKVTGKTPSEFKGADLPVEQVSWADTQKFMAQANDLRTRSGGPRHTFRLPTEAEWEYACRAGTRTEYNIGRGEAALQEAGWYSGNSGGKTNPVGKKAPNALGLHDMHGNVSEIVQDRSGRYSADPAVDPKGPTEGWNRVHRGGSWNTDAGSCRSASRANDNPGHRRTDHGFRCVVVERHKAAAASTVHPNEQNVITFPTAKARFVRFAITKSSHGQPCVDELEVYGPGGGRNLALAKNGAAATASSCLPGYAIHKIAHLNDGLYGNSHSWIAAGSRAEWAQIELPRIANVAHVTFSRDRNGRGRDRIPVHFAVQLSLDGKQWKTVREVKATPAPAERHP